MPANHYDDLVILDGLPTNATGSYLGWGIDAANTDTATLGPRIQPVNVDPSAGVGIAAPLGSLMLRYDAGNVQMWQKTGAADTTWTQIGTLAGSVTLTAISTTATAAFQWTMADNAAAALSLGAAGALGMLVFDTTNAAEVLVVGAVDGLRLNDNVDLRFGTPGTDLVFTPNGTDVVVTSTGLLIFNNDVQQVFGTTANDRFSLEYDVGNNQFELRGTTITAGGATQATRPLLIVTGTRTKNDANAGVPASGAVAIRTGISTVTAAATGGVTGALALSTGTSDSTDAGGTGGATGAVTLGSGAATSTLGTSGATGTVTISSGNSDDGASGDVIITTGTAAGTRGVLDINAATISLATQATDIDIIDNSATAFTITEAAVSYFAIDTSNAAEQIVIGPVNTVTNQPIVQFRTAGSILTDGIDHGTRYVLTEEFQQRPAIAADVANTNASKTFEVAGTNATTALCVFATGGGLQITTPAVDNEQEIITPHTTGADNSQSPFMGTQWSTSDSPKFKCTVRIRDTADLRFGCGLKILTTTFDTSTDADCVWFGSSTLDNVFGTGAANFAAVISIATVDSHVDTTVAVAAATFRFVIDVDSARVARFYINGILRATSGALTAAVTTLKPFVGLQTESATARVANVLRLSVSKLAVA